MLMPVTRTGVTMYFTVITVATTSATMRQRVRRGLRPMMSTRNQWGRLGVEDSRGRVSVILAK